MTPGRWRQVEDVYQQIMDLEPEVRESSLAESCAGDDGLKREVESLLRLAGSQVLVDQPAWQLVGAPPEVETPLSPGMQLGPYRIEDITGEGSMGRVYRAVDIRLDRLVAIKVSVDEFTPMFEQEARTIAALNHVNIATLLDVGPNYLVMELVEGLTLARRIQQGPLPLDETLKISRQIACALAAAHERGIVHRDLKPGNVMLRPDRTVKVLDFGISTYRSGPESAESQIILGTPAYMSPEQARGGAVDRRADIWAFGVLLFEMTTGRHPFGRPATSAAMLAAIIREDPDLHFLPKTAPPSLRWLVERCLCKDPQKRLQDLGEARIILEELEANAPHPVVSFSGRGPVPGHRRRWVAATALLSLVVVALLVGQFREVPARPAVVRFRAPLPDGALFYRYLAVSPDGRYLAYAAQSKGEANPVLWVQALDSLEPRALPNTQAAAFPIWSPNNRLLAFLADGVLKKIDVSTGVAQTLCSMQQGTQAGGYWSEDGFLYFGGSHGITRVSEGGGDVVTITSPDRAAGETGHFYPAPLPDGRHFFAHVQFSDVTKNGIYLLSRDASPKKQWIPSPRGFGYVPPNAIDASGHLLFLRKDALMTQAVNPQTSELVGDAVSVAESVGYDRAHSFFSASAGTLAYRTGGRGISRQLSWFHRDGRPPESDKWKGNFSAVVLSRDGTRAAAVPVEGPSSPTDIWLTEIPRDVHTRFTFSDADDSHPVWSPDGSKLAFASNRDGTHALYLKDTFNVSPEQRLHGSDQEECPTDWAPDGRAILYTRGCGASSQLWILNEPLDPRKRNAKPYRNELYSTTQGQFSPASAGGPQWVAYTSDESKRGSEIFVESFPRGAGKLQISNAGGTQPRWRADGRELFYIAADRRMMAVDVKLGHKFEAGVPRPLFDTRIMYFNSPNLFRYDVTPDGQRFLIIADTAALVGTEALSVILNWMPAGIDRR